MINIIHSTICVAPVRYFSCKFQYSSLFCLWTILSRRQSPFLLCWCLRVLTKFINSWTSPHYFTNTNYISSKMGTLTWKEKASLSWDHKRFRLLHCFRKDISIPKKGYTFFSQYWYFCINFYVLYVVGQNIVVCWLALFKVYFSNVIYQPRII